MKKNGGPRPNSGARIVNDRKLYAKVRKQAVEMMGQIFDGKEEGITELQKQLLFKLAPTLLPRLNEVTGENGEKLAITFDTAFDAIA